MIKGKEYESEPIINIEAKPHPDLHGSLNLPWRNRDDDDTGGVGTSSISVPNLAIQLATCDFDSDKVVNALRSAFPGTDIRPKCFNNSFRLGIWFIPPNSDIDEEARERALERLDILVGGFGLYISGDTIDQYFYEEWKKIPKRYNHEGVPDPHGTIRLTGNTVHFGDDTIITRILGYDTYPWPDVNFEVKITEKFIVSNTDVFMTNSSEVIVDTSYLLEHALLSLLSPFSLPLALIFAVESAIIHYKTPTFSSDQYPGKGTVAFTIIPTEIMIEGGKKLDMRYSNIKVSSGVFLDGVIAEENRQPSIEPASGIVHLVVESGTPQVIASHELTTYDLRPNLVTIWSVDGNVKKTTTSIRTKPSTTISYDSGEARVGSPVFKTLKVKVTDADNLTAEQEFRVEIYARPPPDEFPDIPPICRAKPWLPQCQDL